jgi:hypothetical protein
VSTLLHVRLIPVNHHRPGTYQIEWKLLRTIIIYVTMQYATPFLVTISNSRELMTTLLNIAFPQATADPVPISYRRTLQNTLTHVSRILTHPNKPSYIFINEDHYWMCTK